ncbi:MAG TPA: hypothetical protein VGG25_21290 [Streptosporangiaceae bacterium]
MLDTDLFVLAPWLVFGGAVVTIMVVLISKDRRVARFFRRWRRPGGRR